MVQERIRHEYYVNDKEVVKLLNLKGKLLFVEGIVRATNDIDGQTKFTTEEMV